MTEQERDRLLLKVVQWVELFETCAPRGQTYHDLGHLAIKLRAVQSPAEPKPSVGVIYELGALIAKPPTLGEVSGPCYFVSRRLLKETVAALLAKDADIAAVIRDNDAKIEEIERLKAELHSRYLVAQGAINARQEMEAEATRLMRENQALRNLDVEAAAKRGYHSNCPPLTSWENVASWVKDEWRATARAILTREPG